MLGSMRDLLPVAILFVGALAITSLNWFFDVTGGVHTVGAERVLAGEMPYRDFWTMYAPGHFYLLALLFHIFGSYILVEAIAGSVVSAAAACLYYRLVFNMVRTKLVALLCASIFFAAGYNAGYFRWLGTYPPAIFFILTALNFVVFYYKNGQKRWYLLAAGLATGAAVVFKHDIGGYATIAIATGLASHHFLTTVTPGRVRALVLKLAIYSAGFTAIVVPVFAYFLIHGGMDMVQDLIIFPLRDFRFARAERYPSLIPWWVYDPWRLKMLANVFAYVQFAVPIALVLLGLVGTGLAFQRRKLDYVALGVTFSLAFLLHYVAAHVQINTHIISMTLYAAGLGVMFYDMVLRRASNRSRRAVLTTLAGVMVATVWFSSFAAKPAYSTWLGWGDRKGAVETMLPKLAGIKLSPPEARVLTELFGYVNTLVLKKEKLFIGLHRHDAIIVNDVRMYFLLDRPIAIRYQELHPGIADTKAVQQEIIDDLVREKVKLIILGYFFSDKTLEVVKKNRLQNLPQIGATDLDGFIRENFVAVQKYGPYEIWRRKDKITS